MSIDMATADGVRNFAYSWVDTADQMNPPVYAVPVTNVQPATQYIHIHQVDRIQPTIFEWFFWSHIFSSPSQNTTYNVTNIYTGAGNEPTKTEKKKEESDGSLAMIIAGVMILFGAVVAFGRAFSELHKAYKLQGMAERCPTDRDDAISTIARNALEILQRRVSKLTGYSISTAGLLMGGAALLVGGFFAIPVVGQVGIVVTVVFAVCLLYTTAAHWSDSDEDLSYYRAIQEQRANIETAYEARSVITYQPYLG